MFGAFNRFIGLDAEPAQQPRSSTADNSFGFQVLRNKDPEVPLEPWFDFIIGINGRLIEDPDPNLFATEVRNCAGSSVTFEVWSAKGQKSHTVSLPVPATATASPTLGLAVQLAPLSSTQNIWHVLSIPSPLSPAYRAGLLPHSDYIIGTPSGTLRGESALGELVEDHLDRTLVLWVYNSEFDVVREVELIPTRGWGGEGALGAELGFGALHRLPVGLGEEVEGPGEVVFETAPSGSASTSRVGDGPSGVVQFGGYAQQHHQPGQEQQHTQGYGYGYGYGDQGQGQGQGQEQHQFLVPANLSSPPPPPMAGTPTHRVASPATTTTTTGAVASHGRSHRKARAAPSASAFDEYFAEGLQKSKELDYAPSSRKGTPLPPPPKKGGGAVQSPPPPPVTSGSPSPAAE
ncbi:hypothetical protein BO82DRAFT_358059 [Aspergillus uvarum CBS 121591]|uniref:PDZ GRASP-type domain-containing protein n=1 Tax=Aspergillus uvarum CBS 121591 TaxID=1448315 RepID=A0A319BY70_9EURO|nr:hypothetical protein BO82DRAFT_358059 [Aspergillus uvarum CBS 121591]PYH77684.1 hypothetical protein BO82DRAFT_358059 [Aspergillus uvarum CBS 121591]